MATTLFDNLSAAQRKDIANKILDMSYEDQKAFVEQLSGIVDLNAAAEAKVERKKTAIERIAACKADPQGGRATIDLLNGNLRRGGLPSVEQLVEKTSDEIMQLFAASTMASAKRIECKIILSKLKLID
jgi:hypothetical protein